MLKRKQIYLDGESYHRLKALAARTRLSEAEHIRRAVEAYLAAHGIEVDEAENPLLKLIGLVPKGEGRENASINHDYFLYISDQKGR